MTSLFGHLYTDDTETRELRKRKQHSEEHPKLPRGKRKKYSEKHGEITCSILSLQYTAKCGISTKTLVVTCHVYE